MSIFERRKHQGALGSPDHPTEDTLFINERFDSHALGGRGEALKYLHCTFANISFKDASVTDATFEDCVFLSCYFRRVRLTRCQFPASRFVDCEFAKPQIFDCSFAYTRFTNSPLDYDYVSAAIGGEHNIRRDIAANLAQEAESVGRTRDARQFRLAAIAAHEAYLRAGYRHESDYYAQKFQGLDQFGAWLAFWKSRANGLIWGYGERGWPLLRNIIVLAGIVFPILFLLNRSGFQTSQGRKPSVIDCWYLSLANVVNNTSASGLSLSGGWVRALSIVETAVGLIALGLFITLLFRAVTRR
jgi:hypothetical protein